MYIIIFILITLIPKGEPITCYECSATVAVGQPETDLCFDGGKTALLHQRHCPEPSVCTAYRYQTEIPGSTTKTSITRGCQAVRYGTTCDDIFDDLRKTGSVLPGQHTCTTCSEDLCNAANINTNSFFQIATIIVLIFSIF